MSILSKNLRKIAKEQEAKRQEKLLNIDDDKSINKRTKQYKALIERLKKYDNEKTDAIRMSLLYLESKGELSITNIEKYFK